MVVIVEFFHVYDSLSFSSGSSSLLLLTFSSQYRVYCTRYRFYEDIFITFLHHFDGVLLAAHPSVIRPVPGSAQRCTQCPQIFKSNDQKCWLWLNQSWKKKINKNKNISEILPLISRNKEKLDFFWYNFFFLIYFFLKGNQRFDLLHLMVSSDHSIDWNE